MSEQDTRDDGGRAFPSTIFDGPLFETEGFKGVERTYAETTGGMTLRDYFAAKAMAAYMSNTAVTAVLGRLMGAQFESVAALNHDTAEIARLSYVWADAMLAERAK